MSDNTLVEFNKNDEKLSINFTSIRHGEILKIKEIESVDEPKVSSVNQLLLRIEPKHISCEIKKPNEPKPSFMKIFSEKFKKTSESSDKSTGIISSSSKQSANT